MTPFRIRLEKNLAAAHSEEGTPRYFFEIDLSPVLPGSGRVARLPVFQRPNQARHPILKEFWWTTIAGTALEKGNLAALERAIPDAVAALIDHGTLPYYYVTLPNGERQPVYLVGGKLHLRLSTGAAFVAEDIGALWFRLQEYLAPRRLSEELIEVSILLWKDLQLYPMAFVFRNGRVWFPIFLQDERGRVRLIYDRIGVPARLFDLHETFALRRELAGELVRERVLAVLGALKIDQIREELWPSLQLTMKRTPYVLVYFEDSRRQELPVYQADGEFVALQRRSRARLVIGGDLDELARLVSQDLVQQGTLTGAATVLLEEVKGGQR